MKAQKSQNLTLSQINNTSSDESVEKSANHFIRKYKTWMVKFNKNLSICGAAAAAAIRN